MPSPIKVALAGAGAFGLKHLDGIKLIDGVEVVSLVGRELDKTKEAAATTASVTSTTDLAKPKLPESSTPSFWRRRPRCTPRRRSSAWKPASMSRWRFRCGQL